MKNKKKALIAMSGGVDSSVAAYLTKQMGYECIGCTMKLFEPDILYDEDFSYDEDISVRKTCCSLDDVEDARNVAFGLGMPYYVFNYKNDFKEHVISKFVDSYLSGQTPNPCIDCNRYMKFGKLHLKAQILGCDKVVTGHYARIEEKDGKYILRKAVDEAKDQSYVLYNMTQELLAHTLFPLGGLSKLEARKIAEEQGFRNAGKAESQDICFVPDGDYARVVENYVRNNMASSSARENCGMEGKYRVFCEEKTENRREGADNREEKAGSRGECTDNREGKAGGRGECTDNREGKAGSRGEYTDYKEEDIWSREECTDNREGKAGSRGEEAEYREKKTENSESEKNDIAARGEGPTVGITPGDFISLKDGTVLGRHKGIIHYTIGQRRGLGIAAPSPLYVCRIDPEHNAVILGSNDDLFERIVYVRDVNWIAGEPPFITAASSTHDAGEMPLKTYEAAHVTTAFADTAQIKMEGKTADSENEPEATKLGENVGRAGSELEGNKLVENAGRAESMANEKKSNRSAGNNENMINENTSDAAVRDNNTDNNDNSAVKSIRCLAKIRYRQKEQPAVIMPLSGSVVKIIFDEPQRAITPGQSAVFYDGDIVLGGGTIFIP